MSEASGEATRLLRRLREGDASAGEELLPLIYAELRRLAGRTMQDERTGHTLQPTALVHEAWLRLVEGEESPDFADRAHFVRVAARAMRNILVDHARARRAAKRGGDAARVPLDEIVERFEQEAADVVRLDEALERLGRMDPELGRIVELRFFGGLTIAETGRALERSTATIERGWRVARLWLIEALQAGGEAGAEA